MTTGRHGPALPVSVGDVIVIDEADYCYGRGVLVLHVTAVGRIQHHPDGAWLNLDGVEQPPAVTPGIAPTASPSGPVRHALVRLQALSRATARKRGPAQGQ